MEQTITGAAAKPRIYTREAIRLGAFLGGPFVAAYLMSVNFKAFGDSDKVKKAWLMSTLVFIVLLAFSMVTQQGKYARPTIFVPLLYSLLISFIVRDYQGEDIEKRLNSGGKIYGLLRVIGISIIGAILTLFMPGYLIILTGI